MTEVFCNPNQLIHVKYFYYSCIYEDGDDKEHGQEYMDLYMKAEEKDLLIGRTLFNYTNFLFGDLPMHWKYLEKCIPLQKFPKKGTLSDLILVEKYLNVAIAYDYSYVKQPVAVFRYCCENYDDLEIGTTYKGRIGKCFVSGDKEKTTVVLTDLYLATLSVKEDPLYDISLSDVSTEIREFPIDIEDEKKKLKRYKSCYVMFSNIGSITIPHELMHIFDHKDAIIVATLKYHIRGIKYNFYTCWELANDYTLYINKRRHAISKFGHFRLFSEKEQHSSYEIYNGDEMIRFEEPLHEDEEEIQYPVDCFEDLDDDSIIVYVQEKKRTRIRKF